MRKKNNNVQGDIDEIAKQNKRLEDQSTCTHSLTHTPARTVDSVRLQ